MTIFDALAHRTLRALMLSMLSLSVSCTAETGGDNARDYPTAGLYTPGSMLGASDPTDVPLPGMGLGQRCVAPPGASDDADGGAGAGVLEVTYTTQTLQGRYAPKNCSAVWVETVDGLYVATLELTAGLRRPGLVYWQERACTQELGPDVIASATLRDHQKTHELEWTGVDFMGHPMPDGPYKLYVEVTETDKEPGELAIFDFVKGTESSVVAPVPPGGPLQQLTIVWTTAGGFL